jgi:hypothetical protein
MRVAPVLQALAGSPAFERAFARIHVSPRDSVPGPVHNPRRLRGAQAMSFSTRTRRKPPTAMARQHFPADRGPFVPAYRPDGIPLRVLLIGLDEEEGQCLQTWLQRPRLQSRRCDAHEACATALRFWPGVLLVDSGEQARTRIVEQVLDRCRSVSMGVVLVLEGEAAAPALDGPRCEHLRRPFNRARLLAAVEAAAMPWGAPVATQWHTRQLREEAETLMDLALELASPIGLDDRLQHCADAAHHLTGAAYAALFRHGGDGPHRLVGLAGVPRKAFNGLPAPDGTLLLAPTFAGEGVIRCDDVHAHPRYGWSPQHRGVPRGHPPVRSYLAVPVASREGRLLGALLLGHGEPGVFTARSERLAEAIAAQAAAAIEHHLQHDGEDGTEATDWSSTGGSERPSRATDAVPPPR